MVDIQISVTEPWAAGLVQLIVFMYSSNRRPGPASVMLFLWNKDDGKQGYWSFQSNPVNDAMKTLHWITQISEVVFQWWRCKSVSCALLHWCDVMCWKTQLSLHHNVYTAAEWCRVMAKQSNGVVLGVLSSQSRASSNWSTLQHTGSFPAWDFDKVTKNLPEEFSKMCELARDK